MCELVNVLLACFGLRDSRARGIEKARTRKKTGGNRLTCCQLVISRFKLLLFTLLPIAKSWNFHKLHKLTSSLIFAPNCYIRLHRLWVNWYTNEQKCKQWRHDESAYIGLTVFPYFSDPLLIFFSLQQQRYLPVLCYPGCLPFSMRYWKGLLTGKMCPSLTLLHFLSFHWCL